MLQFIYGVILWIIVPAIMTAMFIFGMVIASKSDSPVKASAWAGFLLGLLAFVIYLVNKLPSFQNLNFTFNSFPDFGFGSWVTLIEGGTVGFFLLWIILFMKPTRGVGVITFLLVAASTCSLFSYIFIESIRDIALFFALGLICGVLLHIMFFPETHRNIFA